VTGADIADDLLNAARSFAERDGLPIRFVTDDAESLSFANASFDGILSTFGVMFAPGQESAASELARVVKPGGRIVLSAWTRDSAIARMFSVIKPYLPTPPDPARPSPFAWGDSEHVTHLLGGAFELRFEPAVTNAYFTSGAAAWEFMSRCYGPTKTLAASLPPDRREALRRDLAAFHERFATEFGITMPRDYHLILGRRI
jgi:SAM-dependent methyltransferase